jgi:hypothetical protein
LPRYTIFGAEVIMVYLWAVSAHFAAVYNIWSRGDRGVFVSGFCVFCRALHYLEEGDLFGAFVSGLELRTFIR